MASIMGRRVRFKKKISPGRVIAKIIGLVIVLWVGVEVLETVRDVVYDVNADWNNTAACNQGGLSTAQALLWSCVANTKYTNSGGYFTTAFDFVGLGNTNFTGIIAILGIIAIASIAMEFIDVQL